MTTIEERPADAGTATQEFAERIVGAVDSASLAILLSIGHQTRLFDTMAELPPATSAQIADAAGLNERYVREWLGGLVAGRVIDFDPGGGDVLPAAPPRGGADASGRAGQPRPRRAVHPAARRGRAEDHRLLPQRRRVALQRLPALPHADGRRERRGLRRRPRRRHPAARRRPAGAAARRRRRRRHRLRQWACHQRDGAGIPGQPVHRHRLLRRGPGRRRGGGAAARPRRTRRSSRAMWPHST